MVLYEFEKIVKEGYKKKKNNLLNENILFDEYKEKCIGQILSITPMYFTGISTNYIESLLKDNLGTKIIFLTTNPKFILNNNNFNYNLSPHINIRKK